MENLSSTLLKKQENFALPSLVRFAHARELGLQSRGGYKRNAALRYAEARAAMPVSNMSCEVSTSTKSTFVITFSPDGTLVASSHGDHTVRVSDLRSGKCLHTLSGHPRTPWTLAFHPASSDILASGCLAGDVRIWDLQGGGSEVWKVPGRTVIASLTFHPTDQVLVIATSNLVYFWDWTHTQPFASTKTANEYEKVRWVKFDCWGHHLYTGIANGSTIQREDPLDAPSMMEGFWSGDTVGDVLRERHRLRQQYRSLLTRFGHTPQPSGPLGAGLPPTAPYSRPSTSGDLDLDPVLAPDHLPDILNPPELSPAHRSSLEEARLYASRITRDSQRPPRAPAPHLPPVRGRGPRPSRGALFMESEEEDDDTDEDLSRLSSSSRPRNERTPLEQDFRNFRVRSSLADEAADPDEAATTLGGPGSSFVPYSGVPDRVEPAALARPRLSFSQFGSLLDARPSRRDRDVTSSDVTSSTTAVTSAPAVTSSNIAVETSERAVTVESSTDRNNGTADSSETSAASPAVINVDSTSELRPETASTSAVTSAKVTSVGAGSSSDDVIVGADSADSADDICDSNSPDPEPSAESGVTSSMAEPESSAVGEEISSTSAGEVEISADVVTSHEHSAVVTSTAPESSSTEVASATPQVSSYSEVTSSAATSSSAAPSSTVPSRPDLTSFYSSLILRNRDGSNTIVPFPSSAEPSSTQECPFTGRVSRTPVTSSSEALPRDTSATSSRAGRLSFRLHNVQDRDPVTNVFSWLDSQPSTRNQQSSEAQDTTNTQSTTSRDARPTLSPLSLDFDDSTDLPSRIPQRSDSRADLNWNRVALERRCVLASRRLNPRSGRNLTLDLNNSERVLPEAVEGLPPTPSAPSIPRREPRHGMSHRLDYFRMRREMESSDSNSASARGRESHSSRLERIRARLEEFRQRGQEPLAPYSIPRGLRDRSYEERLAASRRLRESLARMRHQHSGLQRQNAFRVRRGLLPQDPLRRPPHECSATSLRECQCPDQFLARRRRRETDAEPSSGQDQNQDDRRKRPRSESPTVRFNLGEGHEPARKVRRTETSEGQSSSSSSAAAAQSSSGIGIPAEPGTSRESPPHAGASQHSQQSSPRGASSPSRHHASRNESPSRHGSPSRNASSGRHDDSPSRGESPSRTGSSPSRGPRDSLESSPSRGPQTSRASVYGSLSAAASRYLRDNGPETPFYPRSVAELEDPMFSSTTNTASGQYERPYSTLLHSLRRRILDLHDQLQRHREPDTSGNAASSSGLVDSTMDSSSSLRSLMAERDRFATEREESRATLRSLMAEREQNRLDSSLGSRIDSSLGSRLDPSLESRMDARLDARLDEEARLMGSRLLYRRNALSSHHLLDQEGDRQERRSRSELQALMDEPVIRGREDRWRQGGAARAHVIPEITITRPAESPSSMMENTDSDDDAIPEAAGDERSALVRNLNLVRFEAMRVRFLQREREREQWQREERERLRERENQAFERRWSRTWRQLQRRHLHPHYSLDEGFSRTNPHPYSFYRTVPGAFAGPNDPSLASSMVPLTHRIQRWDVRRDCVPDIGESQRNVIVQHCKIHNDSSVELSQDGLLVAAFVPNQGGFPDDSMLCVYSLHKDNLGQCLFSRTFGGPNAVCVSISPRSERILVGLAAKRTAWVWPPNHLVAQVFSLRAKQTSVDVTMRHVYDVVHPCESDLRTQHVSVNSAKWLPGEGRGLIYGTNRGHLIIKAPGVEGRKVSKRGDIEDENPAGAQVYAPTPLRRNIMEMLGLAPRTTSTSTQTSDETSAPSWRLRQPDPTLPRPSETTPRPSDSTPRPSEASPRPSTSSQHDESIA